MLKKIFIGIGIAMIMVIVAVVIIDFNICNKETEYKEKYELPQIYFLGNNISSLFKIEGEVNTNIIGEYKIKYKFLGWPFLYKKYNIKVVDTKKPELILKGDKEMELIGEVKDFIDPGFEAIDNLDGDITNNVERTAAKIGNNDYTIKYTVSDSFNNVAEEMREVKIVKGIIYLTFDDGPSLENTPIILDALKEKGAKATFFVINYSEDKADLIKRENQEGHTIGLHGYSHNYSEIYSSVDNIMNNFYNVRDRINQTIEGYNSIYIRFPGGSSNTISKKYCKGIMTEATVRALNEGFRYYDWNVDVDDAGKAKTADEIYQNFVNGIKPGKENIVLLHDSAEKTATAEAITSILNYGIENGYDFRNITEKSSMITHSVNN